ncbi:hypothetical protein GHT07_20185 [Caenimonas koreensis DSM 17982]|uniref:Cobalt/nickel transport protein n=1 Tax=Caenimonas koreensis DSM 17982 TaxID=1121255 RepID=A0A844B477_9BURK|nr:hypothetical protein [Caenimonas koreensis]MRD49598.1 hypothetical protein [Caenimonas koreensis DSM 17982]
MSRRLLSFLLLIAFLCQSLPVLNSQGVAERSQQFEHITLHWQDTEHHHHDDLSLHVEDSDDASQHEHADAGFNTACLLTAGWGEIAKMQPLSPDVAVRAPGPTPLLDGLLRPPKAAA